MNSPRTRNIVLLITVVLVVTFIITVANNSNNPADTIPFSRVAELARSGEIAAIEVVGNDLNITLNDSQQRLASLKGGESTLINQLTQDFGVPRERIEQIEVTLKTPRNVGGIIFSLVTAILPILIIGGLIFFFLRQSQGANNQAMSFGKSRARMFNGDRPTVTFESVAGCDEAKMELAEVVEFLKEPEKFIQLGARIPKGVLMVGPPGTGKTLLSKAVAGEAGVPFFSISGSEFVEMFVGVGASRVRDLFDQSKRHSPSIIFIDEIDAVGRQRGAGLGGSHDEREQTLNQILVEMDGFDTDTNVIVIAATNRPDILDPALMRPGRFDRRVVIDRPDVRGREEILKVHVQGKPLAPDVDLVTLAKATPGFVGADLENMINEAAILAARKNKKTINTDDMQEAIERVVMGPERKSRVISDSEKRIVAYHEAGHAVIGYLLPLANAVHKITIIPRGQAGGFTMALPDEDLMLESRSYLMEQIVVLLGGRVAEEIVFGEITSGASDDIRRVTRIARAMVAQLGMSEKLGPMMFGQKEEMVFLGREISEQRDYSEAVAEQIDEEVRKIIEWGYAEARRVLEGNRDQLERVAQRLLEVETVNRDEFEALMNGQPLPPLSPPPRSVDDGSHPAGKTRDDNDSNRPTLGNTAPNPA